MKKLIVFITAFLMILTVFAGCAQKTESSAPTLSIEPQSQVSVVSETSSVTDSVVSEPSEASSVPTSSEPASAETSSAASSAVSSQASEPTTGSTDLFNYDIAGNVITITKYKGTLTDVTVPTIIDSKSVVAVGANAFTGTAVVSVSLENGIASIEEKAFSACTALEFVSIPASVTFIASNAFESSAKARIAAPNGSAGASFATASDIAATYPYEIDNGVYEFEVYDSYAVILTCKSTEAEITVPTTLYGKTVTVINSESFKNLTSLTKVTLPENLTALLDHAFVNCAALQTVVFPVSVITIGENAFDNCPNVKIEAPANSYAEEYSLKNLPTMFVRNASADGFNYAVYSNQVKITAYIGTATTVTVPTRLENLPVTAIESKAFINNTTVTTVNMPDKIYAIGSEAFSGCTALTSIHLSNALEEIPDKLFYNCTSLATMNVPSKLITIGQFAFYRCAFTGMTLPSTVKSIGDSAFYECTKLATISISEGVTDIGNNAFGQCSALTAITLPRSLQYLGSNVFAGCTIIHIYAYTGSTAASMLTAMSIPFTALT